MIVEGRIAELRNIQNREIVTPIISPFEDT